MLVRPTGLIRADWNKPVVCVASGPSFSDYQASLITHARNENLCRVIVVNDNWQRVPNADLIFGCDAAWWNVHLRLPGSLLKDHPGEKWTTTANQQHELDRLPDDMHYIAMQNTRPGLTMRSDVLHGGSNGGYMSINLAWLLGALCILPVGFDMQPTGGKSHWFGEHQHGLWTLHPMHAWLKNFPALVADLHAANVPISNCTRETALRCMPRSTLETELWSR